MEYLPAILGSVGLLLTVLLVAPLALCCCFRKRSDDEDDREPLLSDAHRGQSYGGAPTSSIQSPVHQWGQSVPVTSEDVSSTDPRSTSSQPFVDRQSPVAEASPTQPVAGDEKSKVVIRGEQPASTTEKADEDIAELPITEEAERPQLDEHRVYSLNDFQPFESNTYAGIYGEVQEWVKPLVTNKELHSAYLSYVTPPHTSEKLHELSQFLQEYGKALRAEKPTPAVTYAPMEPVISALDPELSVKLDEVASMIVVSEALSDFPQHIVKKAITLSPEKRTILVDLICSTPHGVDKHVYTDEGPFMDPELNPFMTRMGFSIPSHSKNLMLELKDDENEDRLTAGLIILVATQSQ